MSYFQAARSILSVLIMELARIVAPKDEKLSIRAAIDGHVYRLMEEEPR